MAYQFASVHDVTGYKDGNTSDKIMNRGQGFGRLYSCNELSEDPNRTQHQIVLFPTQVATILADR